MSEIKALERDGFRCVVTGEYDHKNADREIVIAAGGGVPTHCAHIIPDSTFFDVDIIKKVIGI